VPDNSDEALPEGVHRLGEGETHETLPKGLKRDHTPGQSTAAALAVLKRAHETSSRPQEPVRVETGPRAQPDDRGRSRGFGQEPKG
jgi:hypothetical protein